MVQSFRVLGLRLRVSGVVRGYSVAAREVGERALRRGAREQPPPECEHRVGGLSRGEPVRD